MKKVLIPMVMIAALLAVSANNSLGQKTWIRGNVRSVVKDLEQDTDRFKSSLDSAVDRSNINGTRAEDTINEYVKRFEDATDRLRDRAEDRNLGPNAAKEVLARGRSISAFMRSYKLGSEAERDWSKVRHDLTKLASAYGIRGVW